MSFRTHRGSTLLLAPNRPLLRIELLYQGLEALVKLLFKHVSVELAKKTTDNLGRIVGLRGLSIREPRLFKLPYAYWISTRLASAWAGRSAALAGWSLPHAQRPSHPPLPRR